MGLQLRIINGMVSLLTTEVNNKALAHYLSEPNDANGVSGLTTYTLEVLACIAFRQPISQAEIARLFDADQRGFGVKLRVSQACRGIRRCRRSPALRDNRGVLAALRPRESWRIDRGFALG